MHNAVKSFLKITAECEKNGLASFFQTHLLDIVKYARSPCGGIFQTALNPNHIAIENRFQKRFRSKFGPFFFDELQSCANEQSFLEYKLLGRVVHLDFSLSLWLRVLESTKTCSQLQPYLCIFHLAQK